MTHTSKSLNKGLESVCVSVRGIALAKCNIRQEVKSYLIEPKKPCKALLTTALFLPTGTEQGKTVQLNSHFALSQPAVDC